MKDAYVEFDALTFRDARDLKMRGSGILNQENKARKWKVRIQATHKEPEESGEFAMVTTWITSNTSIPLRSLYPYILDNLRESGMYFSQYSKILIRVMRA